MHNPQMFQMSALRSALKLELAGMKRSRGPSAYSIIKRVYGLRGNKQSVYTQFCEVVEREKALGQDVDPRKGSNVVGQSSVGA